MLQALYAWDVRRGGRPGERIDRVGDGEGAAELPRVAAQVWDDLSVAPGERRLAARLVDTVAQHMPDLDRELSAATTNWRLDRLGVIERSILRLAAAELAWEATPPRVVIHEAVRLAERYGSLESARFVNGVLDAVGRRAGRL